MGNFANMMNKFLSISTILLTFSIYHVIVASHPLSAPPQIAAKKYSV